MGTAAALRTLTDRGVTLRVSDQTTLVATPSAAVSDTVRHLITDHKPGIMAVITGIPYRRWIIVLNNGDVFESIFTPPATADDILRWYPDSEITPIEDEQP